VELLSIRLDLPDWRYTTPASIRQFQDDLTTRLAGLPVVRLEGEDQWRTVVGVTSNVLRADIRGSNPEVYVPARQDPRASMVVMVRAGDPERLIASACGEVRALDADLPVREIRTVEDVFDDEMSSGRIPHPGSRCLDAPRPAVDIICRIGATTV